MIDDAAFRRVVWRHYRKNGRHQLPWRRTTDPYAILVSEMMLQQTQVLRVVPKYEAFLSRFPTMAALAAAPLSEVLRLWQGLGYNRRAKYLQQAARAASAGLAGTLPPDYVILRALPGIGDYTAKAILAFAYNQPVVLIETNVRTVFLHHYFPAVEGVVDAQLLPHVARTLPRARAREWYAALMDYGSYLKTQHANPGRRSRGYAVQSRFVGSDRQVRGRVIALCVAQPGGVTLSHCIKAIMGTTEEQLRVQLSRLCDEGMLVRQGRRFCLPT